MGRRGTLAPFGLTHRAVLRGWRSPRPCGALADSLFGAMVGCVRRAKNFGMDKPSVKSHSRGEGAPMSPVGLGGVKPVSRPAAPGVPAATAARSCARCDPGPAFRHSHGADLCRLGAPFHPLSCQATAPQATADNAHAGTGTGRRQARTAPYFFVRASPGNSASACLAACACICSNRLFDCSR